MKLKDIKSMDDVTLIEILDAIQKEFGTEFEKFLFDMFEPDEAATTKALVDLIMEEQGAFLTEDARKRMRVDMLRESIEQSNINTSSSAKVELLMSIYTSDDKKKSHIIPEVKRLLLNGRNFMVGVQKTDKDGKYDYNIIMNDRPKKVQDIKSSNLRTLSDLCINQILCVEDLPSVLKYEELGEAIFKKLLLEFDQKKDIVAGDIEDLSENAYEKVTIRAGDVLKVLENDEELNDEFNKYFKDFMMNNVHYVDTNKLLLNTATRLIVGIKTKKGETFKDIHLKETDEDPELAMRASLIFLKNIYAELNRNSKARELMYSLYSEDGESIIDVDLDYLKDFLSRCTENNYLSDANIEEIHENIKIGELPENLEERRIANIDVQDLIILSNEFGMQEDKEIREKLIDCSVNLIKYLKEEKGLSEEGIVEIYLDGSLDKGLIENLELAELSDKYYINTYKKLYGEILKDRDLEKIKRFSKFASLCDRASDEGKLDKYDMFLEFMEEYEEENILDLYKLETISLEECIDYAGTDILDKMFESTNRTIQPIELRKLYYGGILDFKKMSSLINKIPTNEEKYMTIITIFPDEEDSEVRRDLIDNTIAVDSNVQGKGQGKKKGMVDDDNRDDTLGKDYKKHITDSTYRFQLIRNLDDKYYVEMTEDGHVVLTLPKFKKVIIEKLLDKNRQEGYGAATYILDEDYYLSNEEEINQDGRINRTRLVEANKDDEAVKIRHTIRTWGKNVKYYFEDLPGTEYTEEESKRIDEIIEKIKDSERLVGD